MCVNIKLEDCKIEDHGLGTYGFGTRPKVRGALLFLSVEFFGRAMLSNMLSIVPPPSTFDY